MRGNFILNLLNKEQLLEKIDFIRQYFHPLQPSDGAGLLQYTEFAPSIALQPYIGYYWELKSNGTLLHEHPYHVVADGSVDLIFNCQQAAESMLSVTNTQAFDIQLSGVVHYLGIRFLPACVHYFFEIPLMELTGQTLPSGDCFGKEVKELEAQLLEDADLLQRIPLLETALIQRFTKRNYNSDPRFLQSLHHILQSSGNAFIQTEVAEWISPRQMRRLFERYIGLNPKTFARVTRFQQTLAAMQRTPRTYWGRLFYDYGYFDQAHFIREFKIFYGDTPKNLQFLKNNHSPYHHITHSPHKKRPFRTIFHFLNGLILGS
jgi:AraC-like DNA-binding protein